MNALDAICGRQGITWTAPHRSLRAFGKAVPIRTIPAMQRARAALVQLEPLLDALEGERGVFGPVDAGEDGDLTGWEAVDREIVSIREGFATANSAADYANLARECREVFVSLADAAYDEPRHGPIPAGDGGNVKRRLEAVIRGEAAGASSADIRGVALGTLDLANSLQHRKDAEQEDAATLCDATIMTARIVRRLVG